MSSMRSFINLMEAPRKKPVAAPVVDTDKMLGEIMSLQSVLAGLWNMRFNAEWVEDAVKQVKAKKLSHETMVAKEREDDPEGFNPTDWAFDPKETFREIAPVIVRGGSQEHSIYSDVNTAERIYQSKMNTDPDDLSDMVESSAYLTGLQAQLNFGTAVRSMDVTKPSTYRPVLESMREIVDAFKAFDPDHEKISPEIMDSVQHEIEFTVPMMRFMLKNKI